MDVLYTFRFSQALHFGKALVRGCKGRKVCLALGVPVQSEPQLELQLAHELLELRDWLRKYLPFRSCTILLLLFIGGT